MFGRRAEYAGQFSAQTQVNWDMENDQAFTVQLRVRSHDRKFLLSDISKALGDSGCNIQSATTSTLGQIAEQDFWVDVVDITHLQHAMEKANKIEGVLEVLRIDETFDEHNQASKN